MEEAAKKVLGRLENACARREYCSHDVFEKAVKALDGDRAAAAEIVAKLVEEKYVDDLRYASAFAREKAGITGWGPVKIRFALSAKRIPREIVDEALGEVDEGRADARLEKLLAAKCRSLQGDPQIRLKLLKFALSRGYEYDTVASAVDAVLKDGQSD